MSGSVNSGGLRAAAAEALGPLRTGLRAGVGCVGGGRLGGGEKAGEVAALRAEGGEAEQVGDRDLDPEIRTDPLLQPQGQEGMAAEGEEIVLGLRRLPLQQLGPEGGEPGGPL